MKEAISREALAEGLLSGVFRLAQETEEPIRTVLDWSEEGASLVVMELVFFGLFFLSFHLVATPLLEEEVATAVIEGMFRRLMESLEPQSAEEITLVREHLEQGLLDYQRELKAWIEGEEGRLGQLFLARLGLEGEEDVVSRVEMLLVAFADALREWLARILETYEVRE